MKSWLMPSLPNLSYHLQKILEEVEASGDAKLGGINVDRILKSIEQFKADLAERDILEAYENITYSLKLVD